MDYMNEIIAMLKKLSEEKLRCVYLFVKSMLD